MKYITLNFVALILLVTCGNVFAVSPYANTIQQNIHKKSFLGVASFPTTAADTGFIQRIETKREGYLPYFNRSAFAGLSVPEQDELESMAYRAYLQQMYNPTSFTEYANDQYTHDTDTLLTETPTTTGFAYPINSPQYTSSTTQPYMRASLTPGNIAKYNLGTHNGGCTPPERSNYWNNTIQTSGQYQYSQPAFEKFMITAFRKEGGCVNDPNDRGGYTCYGCASNGLCRGVDFKTLTRAKVENMAYDKIYKQYNINRLPDAFRGYVLWGMWGSGPVTGIKQFQGALGVPLTGKIDEATIYAAEHYTGDFADAYTKNREQFLRKLAARDPKQQKFLRGWLNGLKLLQPSGCHVVPTNPIYR